MAVYILHFSEPIGVSRHKGNGYTAHARHYVGYTENIERRLKQHRSGSGGHLCRVAKQQGIKIKLAFVWEDAGRDFEQYLKTTYKNTPQLCPMCNSHGAARVWDQFVQKREREHASSTGRQASTELCTC